MCLWAEGQSNALTFSHRGYVKSGPREGALCLVYLKHLGEQNQRQDEWGTDSAVNGGNQGPSAPVLGRKQARTLEWVAISFSKA